MESLADNLAAGGNADAIREVLAGRTYIAVALDRESLETQIQRNRGTRSRADHLPRRQMEVLQMAAEGYSNKQIGRTLGISPRTVGFHRYHVMKALGLHTIADVVQYAVKHHLVVL